jgi:hypothetical protein
MVDTKLTPGAGTGAEAKETLRGGGRKRGGGGAERTDKLPDTPCVRNSPL